MVRLSRALTSFLVAGSASAFAPTSFSPPRHAARSLALEMTAEDSGAKDPVKVGVIGCGRIGIVHLGAINKAPGVVPIVVSNPTVSKAENGECTLYNSLRPTQRKKT